MKRLNACVTVRRSHGPTRREQRSPTWTAPFRLTRPVALLAAVGCASAASTSSWTSPARTSGRAAATLATAPVGVNPDWDDLDPVTDTIYVANGGAGAASGNTVSVINGRTCRTGDIAGCEHRSPTVNVGASPFSLAVDPTTDTVYVPNGNKTVAVINGATCNANVSSGCRQRPPEVTVGGVPSSVAIDPANHTGYVTNARGNDVSMINTLRCSASKLSGCRALRPPTADRRPSALAWAQPTSL